MSTMTCAEFVELVTAALDGALDAGTQRRFADHVSSCDGCERYLDQFQRTRHALAQLRSQPLWRTC